MSLYIFVAEQLLQQPLFFVVLTLAVLVDATGVGGEREHAKRVPIDEDGDVIQVDDSELTQREAQRVLVGERITCARW